MSLTGLRRFLESDPPRLRFGFATAAAAWLAIVLAAALDLPNGHWAGVTVLTVSQPTRGLLLEKCLWRLIGTTAGALAGIGLLAAFASHPAAALVGLTLWLSCCAGFSALVRHFRSYGAVLAGYTCAIVALIDFEHPAAVQQIAYGRIACTIIGILAATAVTGLLMPHSGRRSHLERTRQLGADLLERCDDQLSGRVSDADEAALLGLVARLGDLDAEADEVFDGTPGARWRKRRLRNLLASLLLVTARARAIARPGDQDHRQASAELATLFRRAAACFRNPSTPAAPPIPRREDGRAAPELLAETQAALAAAMEDLRDLEQAPPSGKGSTRLAASPDWRGALRAATRVALCVLPVGLAWLASGWVAGSLMLLGTCVFVTLLSANELGAPTVRRIVLGVLAGVGTALAFRTFVLPNPAGLSILLLALLPVLCVTAAGLTFRLTAVSTVEFNNFFLMMSQPTHLAPLGLPLLQQGLAMVAGVGAAALALHLVMPLDIERRKGRLRQALARDMAELAEARTGKRLAAWEGRTLSRGLRLLAGTGPARPRRRRHRRPRSARTRLGSARSFARSEPSINSAGLTCGPRATRAHGPPELMRSAT
ncbi:FUSC family protein [Methylobacterium nigriterrae]|uniref:FUSC family protein n=1 Tax=Methylobacterium nigriterrae TaxID=3127512 RepID=UPI0030135978